MFIATSTKSWAVRCIQQMFVELNWNPRCQILNHHLQDRCLHPGLYVVVWTWQVLPMANHTFPRTQSMGLSSSNPLMLLPSLRVYFASNTWSSLIIFCITYAAGHLPPAPYSCEFSQPNTAWAPMFSSPVYLLLQQGYYTPVPRWTICQAPATLSSNNAINLQVYKCFSWCTSNSALVS